MSSNIFLLQNNTDSTTTNITSLVGDDSDGTTTTTLTVGTLFVFAIMGVFPIIITVLFVRKFVVAATQSKHGTQKPTQPKTQRRSPRPKCKKNNNNNSIIMIADNDTLTSSIHSGSKIYLEEPLPIPPVKSTTTELHNNWNSLVKYNVSSLTITPAPPNLEIKLSELKERNDKKSLWVDDDHDNNKNDDADDNDTITARLQENCVRLLPNLWPLFTNHNTNHHSIQTTAVGTTIKVSQGGPELQMNNDTSRNSSTLVEYYRRACRPPRIYFDEIVPSDIELGLQGGTKISSKKSRTSTSATTTTAAGGGSNSTDDELLHPTPNDLGMIQRYFALSSQPNKKKSAANDPKDDDPSQDSSSCCSCPNAVSISSSRSRSSSSSVDEISCYSSSSSISNNNDGGYYDASLYSNFYSPQHLGDLVDI